MTTNQNNTGDATEDKVFLLSVAESLAYFSSNADRKTAMGIREWWRGMREWWWLRSRGFDDSFAAVVDRKGAVSEGGGSVGNTGLSVRPALWLNLST
jgi:hypothetical protein